MGVSPIKTAIEWFFKIIEYAIWIRILLSWIIRDRSNPIVDFIYTITEPILAPFRKAITKSALGGSGMFFDFSPVVAMMALQYLAGIISSVFP